MKQSSKKDIISALTNYKLIGGVFIAMVLFGIYQKFFAKKDEVPAHVPSPDDDEEQQNMDDIANQVSSQANISIMEATVIANGLDNAFSYNSIFGYGTDESSILALLKPEYSTADRTLIYSMFGIRPYDGNATYNEDDWFTSVVGHYSLGEYCRAELSGSTLTYCENYFASTPYNNW